jgi:hypothetical protein
MKNSLKRVFLDKEKTDLLTQYLLKKQYIDTYIDGEKINYENRKQYYQKCNLIGIKKLFIIMTLYEEIDFMRSNYNYKNFFDMGISEISRNEWSGYGIQEVLDALYLLKISHKNLFSVYKNKYDCFANQNEFERLVFDIYTPLAFQYSYKNVNEIFLEANKKVKEEGLTNSKVNILFFINQVLTSLVEGLGFSSGFYTDIFQGDVTNNSKIVDDMYYICKFSLPKELNMLPAPQTLKDVISFRKSPYIKSFRCIFEEWMNYVEEGNISLAKKIEKDVIKANRCFEKLEKYHKISNSPFVRTGLFIGGFIPGLSEVINISTYAGGLIEDVLIRKNNWVLISNKKN